MMINNFKITVIRRCTYNLYNNMTFLKPSGLVLSVPVTFPPSPSSLKATTVTVYSVLAVRLFMIHNTLLLTVSGLL